MNISVLKQPTLTLDASDQDFSSCRLVNEWWGLGVDGCQFCGLDRATLVDRVTSDIHNASQSARPNRNLDRSAGIVNFPTTDETLGT